MSERTEVFKVLSTPNTFSMRLLHEVTSFLCPEPGRPDSRRGPQRVNDTLEPSEPLERTR